MPHVISRDDFCVIDDYKGIGYAISTEEELKVLINTAQKDGILFDPVYSVKAWKGLLDLVKRNHKKLGERPLFIHTGGIYGVLAKAEEIS